MNNFNYYAPTKVVFGKDTEKETGRLVKEQGASSVLVHFGGKSAIASGLLDRVCQSLKEEGIAYDTLGGVVPNPRLSKVREGISLCREKKIDFILAVGGGSVIDSAKAIGYGVAMKVMCGISTQKSVCRPHAFRLVQCLPLQQQEVR